MVGDEATNARIKHVDIEELGVTRENDELDTLVRGIELVTGDSRGREIVYGVYRIKEFRGFGRSEFWELMQGNDDHGIEKLRRSEILESQWSFGTSEFWNIGARQSVGM